MNTKDGYAKKSLTSARLLTADGGDTDNYLPLTGGTMTGALVTTALSVSGAATFSQAINGNILGNAATASRLQNARTISLTGAVTGSGSFDGSGNLSIATTKNHNHALGDLSNVSISNPSNGQVLKFNGTNWVNGADNAGSGGDGNTWRGIYTDGISRIGTGINTKAVNFVAGDNTSITYIQAGATYSGSNDYFNIKFSCTPQQWFKIYKNSNSVGVITYTYPNWLNLVGMSPSYPQYCYYNMSVDDKFLCFTIQDSNTQSDEVLVGFGSVNTPGDTYTRQVMFDFHSSKVYKKIGSTVTQIRESFSQGPYILKISGTTAYFYLNKTLLSTETLSNIPNSLIIHSNVNSSINIYINDFGMLQPLIVDDLYNTFIYNPSQGQVLKYNSQSGLWSNSTDETSSGGGSTSGITALGNGYWSGSVSGTTGTYAPFTSRQNSACFYTGTTDPNGATRLNYNGYLYATKLYSNGTEVSVEGHSHSYAAVSHNHSGHDLIPNSITLGGTSGSTSNLYMGANTFDFRHGTTVQFELTLQNGNTSADDVLSIKSSNNTTNLSLGLSTVVVTSDNYTNYLSGGGATALTGLSDVSISSPSNGQVLKYNGSKWVNGTDNTSSGGGGSTVSLPSGDITLSTTAQTYITANNVARKIKLPTTCPWTVGSTTLSGLTDTNISSPTNGQYLKYNGSKWVNSTGTSAAPVATSWFDSTGTKGIVSPTLTDDSRPKVLIPKAEYAAFPVIQDSEGNLWIALPADIMSICNLDGWDES